MFTLKKGFTLIELLVVIAIIAILAAILFPVFAQAREKARQANCLSNMKQIGTAFALYADDYDETTPGVTDWSFGGGGVAGYLQTNMYCHPTAALYPYTKNSKIFICPSAPSKNLLEIVYNYPTGTDQNGGSSPATGTSYCFNGIAYNQTPLASIGNTSQLMFCCEMNKTRTWNVPGEYPSSAFIQPTPTSLGANTFTQVGVLPVWNCQAPHNGGQNVTFCDSHAKYCKTGSMTFRNFGVNPASAGLSYGIDDVIPNANDDNWTYSNIFLKTYTAQLN